MDTALILKVAGAAVVAYLAASVNFSILALRLLGKKDIREQGSGNPGATNVLRVAGWFPAAAVLLLDLGRAYAVVWGSRLIGLDDIAPAIALPFLLGNLFPIFHGWKGGKGVAAATGAFLAVSPLAFLIGGGVFLATVAISRFVSLGSMLMIASYPLVLGATGGSRGEILAAGTAALTIVFTHRTNIGRIVRGKEHRIFGRADDPGSKEGGE